MNLVSLCQGPCIFGVYPILGYPLTGRDNSFHLEGSYASPAISSISMQAKSCSAGGWPYSGRGGQSAIAATIVYLKM